MTLKTLSLSLQENTEDFSTLSYLTLTEHHAGTFPKLTLEMNAWNFSIDENALLFAEGIGEIEIKVKEPSEDDSKA